MNSELTILNSLPEDEDPTTVGVEIEGVILSLVEMRRLYSRYATEKDKKFLGRDIFEDQERIADEELDGIYSDWNYREMNDLLYDWITERIEPDTTLVWDPSVPVLVLYPDELSEESLRELERKTGKRAVNVDKYID